MRQMIACAFLFGLFALAGCHSAYVEATVHNGTGDDVTLLEVDYPSASFGKESLPANTDFKYRFKILGGGETKVQWTDGSRQEHSVAGPALREGQEGSVYITLEKSTAIWQVRLRPTP